MHRCRTSVLSMRIVLPLSPRAESEILRMGKGPPCCELEALLRLRLSSMLILTEFRLGSC